MKAQGKHVVATCVHTEPDKWENERQAVGDVEQNRIPADSFLVKSWQSNQAGSQKEGNRRNESDKPIALWRAEPRLLVPKRRGKTR